MSSFWRPYTQEGLGEEPLKVSRAQGAHIFLEDGRALLDGISSWWLTTHGHCHPRLVAAVQKQVADLDQVVFANFTHEPAEILKERLQKFLPPSLSQVFVTDNGSTAVEVAMKMALQFWRQRGQPEKSRFLSLAASYHGDTAGVMSLGGDNIYSQIYSAMMFEVLRVSHPRHQYVDPMEYARPVLEQLEKHHAQLAALVMEPLIQGAGGMVVWPAAAVNQIVARARELEVLVVFDEVMTGFGRTGRMFATDHLQEEPDFLCLSKGLTGGFLPLGLTVTTDEIFAEFKSSDKKRMLFHGHSFTGNPVSMTVAAENLALCAEPSFDRDLLRLTLAQKHAVQEAARQLPVRDVRHLGTMAALELELPDLTYTSDFSNRVTQGCLKRGLYVRPMGDVVYLLPPYCTTDVEVSQAWETIADVVQTEIERL